MHRTVTFFVVLVLLMGMTTSANAANPDPFKGRWVALDIDDSVWHITISKDQFHGHDSGTIPGEGARTRTWGAMQSIGEYEREATLNLQFMVPGPPQYWTSPDGWSLTYDPGSDTILGDQGPFPLIQFCRVPCDPYEYPPV